MVTSTQDAHPTLMEKWQDRWDGRLGDYVWLAATVIPGAISSIALCTFTILLLIH